MADYFSVLTNNITILAKKLNPTSVSLSLSDYKVAAVNVTYTLTFTIANQIPANGIIDLYMPKTPSFLFTAGSNF